MDEKKVSEDMKPGTIVLQKMNINEFFVGIVVGDHMAKEAIAIGGVTGYDLGLLKAHESHLCLNLGYFAKEHSLFREHVFNFPCYIAGAKSSASPIDLSSEIEFCKHLELTESFHTREMFGFPSKQLEILKLVSLAEWYKRGAREEDVPNWAALTNSEYTWRFLDELRKAIPRP